MGDDMKYDAYAEVINSVESYLTIGKTLHESGVCVIGWTDEMGTHHDILFAVRVPQFGQLQGGQSGMGSLFVTILRRSGGFGFSNDNLMRALYPTYVAEKLGLPEHGSTTEKITQLINGVRMAYDGMR